MEKDRVCFLKECQDAVKVSHDTLYKILQDNKDTEYGRKYNFAQITELEEYKKLPITDYEDYKNAIERMMTGEENVLTAYPIEYFLTSSGSTKQKVIPITRVGLSKGFDVFYNVALPDDEEWEGSKHLHTSMVRTKKEEKVTFLSNAHFWNVRETMPGFFDKFVGETDFMFAEEIGDAWYVKLWLALAEPELRSIYSIYQYDILLFLQYFKEHWNEILRDMESRNIPEKINISPAVKEKLLQRPLPEKEWLEFIRKECEKGFEGIGKRIWKNLAMINGIGGEVFGTQEQMLRYLLGDVSIHYFAYASSEAPIGIAIEEENDSYVCIPQGCFLEFIDIEEEELSVKWMDELEIGKKYEIIVTNYSGFYRYRLQDVAEVTGFYGQSPIIRFAFRRNQAVNIAGEKTNLSMIADAVKECAGYFGKNITEYSVCVDETVMPNRYCFFLEGNYEIFKENYDGFLDAFLCKKNNDYDDLRQLGQVASCVCVHVEDGSHTAWKMKQGMKGHSKPLPFSKEDDYHKFMMERERKVEI